MSQSKGQGARARTPSAKSSNPRNSPVASSSGQMSEVLAPFKMPTSLTKQQSPFKDEVFMGENIFSSDFASGGGERASYGERFSINCLAFDDLLDHEYTAIVGEDRKAQSSLPQCLFDYYCYTALWRRMLSVSCSNGVLDDTLLSDLERLEEFGDFYLPDPVVKYIQGIGNFTASNGVLYRFDFEVPDLLLASGWINGLRGHLGANVNGVDLFPYLIWPMPYTYCRRIQKTIERNQAPGAFNPYWDFDSSAAPLAPSGGTDREVVGGICGHKPIQVLNSAAIAQITNLGWSAEDTPESLRESALNIDNKLLELVGSRMAATSKLQMTKYSVEANANPNGSKSQMVRISLDHFYKPSLRAGRASGRPTMRGKVSTFCREQLSPSQWRAGHLFGYQFDVGEALSMDLDGYLTFPGCGWIWHSKAAQSTITHMGLLRCYRDQCYRFGDKTRSRTFVIDSAWKDDSLSNVTQSRVSKT